MDHLSKVNPSYDELQSGNYVMFDFDLHKHKLKDKCVFFVESFSDNRVISFRIIDYDDLRLCYIFKNKKHTYSIFHKFNRNSFYLPIEIAQNMGIERKNKTNIVYNDVDCSFTEV